MKFPSHRILLPYFFKPGWIKTELYIIFNRLAEICRNKGLKIVRSLVGRYITSLEMQGCSITLLRLDDEMIRLWDAPVNTPSLRWGI